MDRTKRSRFSIHPSPITLFIILLLFLSVSLFTGCGSSDDSSDDTTTESSDSDSSSSSSSSVATSDLEDDYDESDYTYDDSDIVYITLSGSSITVGSDGYADVSGSVLTITSAATYSISGSLTDGRIIVSTDDEETVQLIFNGIDIQCDDNAPVYIENAERTAIILAEGTENYLTDASAYTYEDDEDEPNAALHSKDYLTIGGTGSLTVTGNYNDGITGKDGLIIAEGTITVAAVDDGIRGKDYLLVKGGTINVSTDGGDGFKSDNDEDTEKGYISIEAGDIDIDAEADAMQAETYVLISGGDFALVSGGGSESAVNEDVSQKAIKGGSGVQIDDGDFTISAADDAIHSDGSVIVNGGVFNISSGDDGIHADTSIEIYGGDISVMECYEGIESAEITIADGNIYIESSDDGVNVAGGNDGSGGGGPGDDFASSSGDYYLYIDGGYLAVYSEGDGLDSNGNIEMTGGTVLIHGPSDDNSALDFDGSFTIDGGFIVTAGGTGTGMESPGTSSTQNFKQLTFTARSAGTLFHVESSDGGTDILTFKPSVTYSSVLVSSPDLEDGSTYDFYLGGSSTGTAVDGLYEDGTYSGGSQYTSFSF